MMQGQITFSVVGRGAISSEVATAVRTGSMEGMTFLGSVGRTLNTTGGFSFDHRKLDELQPTWILEAAGVRAAEDLLAYATTRDVNLILMSAGALADGEARRLTKLIRSTGRAVLTPSGAIGGLDIVRALCATGDLLEVSLITTKAPAGWTGAPYLVSRGIHLDADNRSEIFRGSAGEAISGFPANTNVAVALALTGLGLGETAVTLHSDPRATRTTHQIHVRGSYASVDVTITTDPHQANPRTSRIAAASAIATLSMIGSGEISTPRPPYRELVEPLQAQRGAA